MYRFFFGFISLVVITLLFSSCTTQKAEPNEKVYASSASKLSFPEEDAYILFALRAEQIKDNKSASKLFSMLYEKSNKKEYLYRALNNDIVAKDNQKVINIVDEKTDGSLEDFKLVRYKIVALIELKRLDEAVVLAVSLMNLSESVDDYILVSDIYIKQKKFNIALKYLESAYIKNYNERVLDKMSIIMYVNLHKKKDAIAQLETHSRINGCSKLICNRLIGFYSNENNIDGILETYLRMYKSEKDPHVAKKIVQIYGYKQNYLKMESFLEKSQTDDKTLLQLYTMTKNYKKAYLLADKLYENSGDIIFLGQSAIYEYENSAKKYNKKLLASVVKKLELVIEEDDNPLYKNYLGYILIDHSVNIKKGIKYIKDVLKLQPNSAYYLDSLAWGYYRLGKCKKAKKVMEKVITLDGGDDKEVKVHIDKIQRCINNKKGKNRE